MMQNDIDREKLAPFRQNREAVTVKLPQVQNKEKKTPKHTRLLLGV